MPLSCSDGEWHNLMTISDEGTPLTEFQLARQVWKNLSSITKPHLLTLASNMNKLADYEATKKYYRDNKVVIEFERKPNRCLPLKTPMKIKLGEK